MDKECVYLSCDARRTFLDGRLCIDCHVLLHHGLLGPGSTQLCRKSLSDALATLKIKLDHPAWVGTNGLREKGRKNATSKRQCNPARYLQSLRLSHFFGVDKQILLALSSIKFLSKP
jgi:hypothetical protein